MSLAAGRRFGSYEIVSLLGAGGMGEVYRARDSQLNRDVAVKVLPALFAQDADRLARFTREAQALAALNHPNIAQVYGLEGDGSAAMRGLVMELVQGEDLSVLIERGPIPLAEALPIARQIADALEAAHEQGIIHRDLKPANVKVRADGTVKVLDFGLAKAMDPAGSSHADARMSPTLTARATQMGTIIGTAAYMAPEQAKAKAVDKRADIWAFGIVLYEMLTGRRAFDGDDISTTLAAVLMKEPEWTALPAGTPPGIRTLVEKCLVKDPRQRLRDMGDARLQIEDALAGRTGSLPAATGPAALPAVTRGRSGWQVAAAMAAVAVVAAGAAWLAKPSSAVAPILRLSIALPAGDQVTSAPAISPDGRMVAYTAGRTPATSQLYLRPLDDFSARAVASGAGSQYPFFSPDGRDVAFFAAGKLRRASVSGGAALDIASSPTPWGGAWDSDGRVVFTTGLGSGLWRVPADGGRPEQLTKPDGADGGYAHVFPQRLPGTRDLLFAFWGKHFFTARLSSETGTWREVTSPARAFAGVHLYTASGHLLTNDGAGGVMAGRWDPSTTAPVTPQTPVLEDVNWALSTERAWLDVSDNGTAVYVPGNPGDRQLVWVDRQGVATTLPGDADLLYQATLSPDGRRVVYGSMKSQWVMDLATGTRTRVVGDARSWHGGWLPGSDRLVVSSNKDGDWDLYTVSAGGGELKPLLKKPFAQHVQAVAPDGTIVYLERQPLTGSDLWTLKPDGTAAPLVVSQFNESSASVSPDGRFIAYVSDESGRNDVYVIPASGQGNRVVVSIDGGTGPVWSRDGRELFYRRDDDLLTVQVRTTGALVLGERRRLLDLSRYDSGYFHEFDVSPDGQRFLLIRTESHSRPTRLDIVVNWFDQLNALVPRK